MLCAACYLLHIFQGLSKADVSLPGTLGTRLEFEQVQSTRLLHAASQDPPLALRRLGLSLKCGSRAMASSRAHDMCPLPRLTAGGMKAPPGANTPSM